MEEFQPTVRNIIEQQSLKWIFVGGKGGVGKTTTSSSLSVLLAEHGKRVLIISTDPAHNLSDCFDQKFTSSPLLITGFNNLYGMQIDPKIDPAKMSEYDVFGQFQKDEGAQNLLSQLISSVPGIDEAMSFAQLVRYQIFNMEFDTIVFDTAPTGHTLRFLNFPTILEKGLDKIISLKMKFSNVLSHLGGILGKPEEIEGSLDKLFGKIQKMKTKSALVNAQMKDYTKTTFVAVCIPQFLSMYETERLIQQLAKFNIDIHNIVINQVLFPEDNCKMCVARSKMQMKYLKQLIQLYDDFHVTIMPLQDQQVRGVQKLRGFSKMLLQMRALPKQLK